jgi:hypothetical protein
LFPGNCHLAATLNTILASLGVLTAQAGEDYYGRRFIMFFEPMAL